MIRTVITMILTRVMVRSSERILVLRAWTCQRFGLGSVPRSEVEVFFNRNAVVSGTSGGRNRDAVERLRILSFPG